MHSSRMYHFSRVRAAFLLVVVLFAAQALPARITPDDSLTRPDRAELFETVWTLVNERYYDSGMNGVDWEAVKDSYVRLVESAETDEEFYDLIKRMLGELNDAHTRFLTPREAKEDREQRGTTAGVLLKRFGNTFAIEKVLPSQGSDLAKIRPGMIVKSVDGKPASERFREALEEVGGSSTARAVEIKAIARMLRGAPGSKLEMVLIDESGSELGVSLTRQTIDLTPEVETRELANGVGYISVSSFKSPAASEFRKALQKMKGSRGLVVDLRYNGGGSVSEVLQMAGLFLDERTLFGKYLRRSDDDEKSESAFWTGKKGGQIFSGPVVVLTNNYSASGSELFASGLQEAGRVRVVGARTCGCLLGVSKKHRLKDGSELRISDVGFLSAKGRIYERLGIDPDLEIEATLEDLRDGSDRELSEAESLLSAQ